MIGPFNVSNLPRIVFGCGRMGEVPGILASFGDRLLLVTGAGSFQSSDHFIRLAEGLRGAGLEWETVCVKGEPSPAMVDETVRALHKSGIEVVLAIGGGSAIDAAKAIAGLLPHGNSVMDHLEGVGREVPYNGPSVPLVAVPTTSGTGAEATKNAVLSFQGPQGFKRSFRHDALMPDVAVVDPELTFSCPPDLTAASGMDAVTQLIEAYVSSRSNPITDALALSGLQYAKDGLYGAYKGDVEGRTAMSYAALASGICLSQAGLGVVHGLASPLGSHFPIPHGNACAVLLAPATDMNIKTLRERDPQSAALPKYAHLGRLLTKNWVIGDREAQDALVDTLRLWTKRLEIPDLSRYGVAEGDLDGIASACTRTDPAKLTHDEVVGILRAGMKLPGSHTV